MLSRATSLDGLVILTPFSKDRITCRRSEDVRTEFRRLDYLALQTVVDYGSQDEARTASYVIGRSYGAGAQARDPPVVPTEGADAGDALEALQRANAVLLGPPIRAGKLPVTAAGIAAATLSIPSAPRGGPTIRTVHRAPPKAAPKPTMRKRKRPLDDTSPVKESKKSRRSY